MFGKLESLRGVAALMVVLYHSPFTFGQQPLAVVSNGYLFVDFFFVLSGFVMCHAYGHKITAGLPFRKYVLLRLGRIYPLHLFVLLMWVPYVFLKQYMWSSGLGGVDQTVQNNAATFVSNLLLLHSMGLHDDLSWNGPSWSISTEFFAYVAFFVVAVTADRRAGLAVPVVISVACYALLFSLDRPDFDITYDFGFFRCVGAFYLGVFVYRLKAKAGARYGPQTLLEMLCLGAVIFSVSRAGMGPVWQAACVLSFAATIAVFSSPRRGPVSIVLETTILRKIGEWSYSVYLLHALLVAVVANAITYGLGWDVARPLGIWSLLYNLALVAVLVSLSRFTYIHVERKYRDKVKERLRRTDGETADVSAVSARQVR